MNILHFSASDLHGGAAKAAYRLHDALRHAGHNSKMIVCEKLSDDPDVMPVAGRRNLRLWRKLLDELSLGSKWRRQPDFNLDLVPAVKLDSVLSAIDGLVDVICLHWINGLLSTRDIAALANRYKCPIVWVLQDLEPLTGGCHYPGECDGFLRQCGCCPQLISKREHDRSRTVWKQKKEYFKDLPITLVSGSSWLNTRAKESSLWKGKNSVEIADSIDINVFRPFDQRIARQLLHLPQDAHILFFGAFSLTNPRKGMKYLQEALDRLHVDTKIHQESFIQRPIHLLVAGYDAGTLLKSLPFPYTMVGFLRDDITLALAYQAADVFLCPSVDDAGPMMVPEAMLCGTQVVAFKQGIAMDLISTSTTGYLSRLRDSADFSHGILTALTVPFTEHVRNNTFATALHRHSPAKVAAQHSALYESLCSSI